MDPKKSRVENLQLFLYNFLKPVLKEALSPKYFDESAMKIWLQAFTNESVSPDENYEELEFFGDRILGAVFAKYLLKRLPGLKKGQYTELKNMYMSKEYQGKLSRQLGFSQFIAVSGDTSNLNLDEDVFEAFFGALEVISDAILPGLGFINCYNLIVFLFQDTNIFDEERAKGGPKTVVAQIFSRFGLPPLRENVVDNNITKMTTIALAPKLSYMLGQEGVSLPSGTDALVQVESGKKQSFQEAAVEAIETLVDIGLLMLQTEKVTPKAGGGVEFSIYLRPAHMTFLAEHQITLKDPLLAQVKDLTKKKASNVAYERALEKLRVFGITLEWAAEQKAAADFSDPAIQEFLPAARARLQQEGMVNMKFVTVRSSTSFRGNTVQLIGIDRRGKERILIQRSVPFDDKNGKVRLVREYGQGKK